MWQDCPDDHSVVQTKSLWLQVSAHLQFVLLTSTMTFEISKSVRVMIVPCGGRFSVRPLPLAFVLIRSVQAKAKRFLKRYILAARLFRSRTRILFHIHSSRSVRQVAYYSSRHQYCTSSGVFTSVAPEYLMVLSCFALKRHTHVKDANLCVIVILCNFISAL